MSHKLSIGNHYVENSGVESVAVSSSNRVGHQKYGSDSRIVRNGTAEQI